MLTDSKNGHCSGDSDRENLGQKNGQRYSPPISTGNRNSFDIRDHVDKLTPAKEKGRYICPVCEDDNFTIRENDGAFQCWSNGCDSQAIMDAIAPLKHRPQSAKSIPTKRKPRKKSRKQKDRDVEIAAAELECKVDELIDMVEMGYETKETAGAKLAEWCKQESRDKFTATQLFNARVKERIPPTASEEAHKLLKEYRLIEQHFGKRLQYNTLFKRVELDSKPFDPAAARLEMIVTHGLSLKGSREDIADITVKLSKANEYSPVTRYLESTLDQHGDNTSILDNLADRYLGADIPIHQTLIKKFLIAAVARAYEPGCKHDCALILQGRQGYRKSTFFRTLASEEWFDDSLGATSDKDERLKLHQRWMIEWAELETVFRRKDVSQVKAFMSCPTDLVRAPYARSSETMRRSSVIVGSTNQQQFLADPTGNRRFWVIPVTKPINVTELQCERDLIWAAATTLYLAGTQWWLNDEEQLAVDQEISQYEARDPWFEVVTDYVDCMDAVSTNQILINALDIPIDKLDSGKQRRVASIMRALVWEQTKHPVSHCGKRARVWKKDF
ncbi:virulence-associated E family protein [Leptothoe sp. LEGE 181152]|nr:virulence-associated E family protein [Leptothoe sp. LEGE 181152]